jgi:hypothetical protein
MFRRKRLVSHQGRLSRCATALFDSGNQLVVERELELQRMLSTLIEALEVAPAASN